jgi:hypothetical protein
MRVSSLKRIPFSLPWQDKWKTLHSSFDARLIALRSKLAFMTIL